MQVIDLTDEHRSLYYVCLEDWSEEMKEAGDHKRLWAEEMSTNNLRVKLAVDDGGRVGGMIEYMPIQYAPAVGEGLYFINCIWVHGHGKGRGNFQKQGMGTALLRAAEDDARALGATGMAAWGLILPLWMKASWFKRHGYGKADRQGISALVFKPFSGNVLPPRWIRPRERFLSEQIPGKLVVTSFVSSQCPGMNLVHERAKRAASEFGGSVEFRTIRTNDPAVMRRYGLTNALFVDRKNILRGKPPAYETIHRAIRKGVAKIR